MTDGSYAYGEHSIGLVKSLSCIPEADVTLCGNYTSIKKSIRCLLFYSIHFLSSSCGVSMAMAMINDGWFFTEISQASESWMC